MSKGYIYLPRLVRGIYGSRAQGVRSRVSLFLFGMMFFSTIFANNLITKVVDVQYKSAQSLAADLQPLLQAGESITASGSQLIVNVSPETLTKVRAVLHELDTPPVVFLVEVHQGQANWLDAQDSDSVQYGTTAQQKARNNQSVQVDNGKSALVSIGQNVPVVSSVGAGLWTGVNYQREDLQQGFLVEPKLQGKDRVLLKIKRIRDNQDQVSTQQLQEQSLTTTTTVPLGKWTSLGSSEKRRQLGTDDANIYQSGADFSNDATLFIKFSIVKPN